MKIDRDRMIFFIGLLTIEIYWPKFLNNNADIGIYCHSQISYKKFDKHNLGWFTRAGVLRILGFGIGLAWNHCDNPNRKEVV